MRISIPFFALLTTCALAAGWGCSSANKDSGFDTGPGGPGSSSSGSSSSSGGGADASTTMYSDSSVGSFGDAVSGYKDVAPGIGCTNLQCQVPTCDGGATTTITGKVLDPAGHNPLYNVVVFVPNTTGGALPLIPGGLNANSCSCGALYDGELPVVDTLTAADGTFTLKDVPAGTNIPLVIQIGKWRKEIVIPQVNPCVANTIPGGTISMPKNKSDGLYASMPNIAVSTGGADTLECLLTRIGIDEAEYTGDPNTGAQHVHVFQGSGGNAAANSPVSSASLWDSKTDLSRYDIVMLSCEGSPTTGAQSQPLADYVSAGGRVFAEHYHYQFFANQTQFANTANWLSGQGYTGAINAQVQTTLMNGNPFPEGQALQQWLTNVGALTGGFLNIPSPRADAIVQQGNVSTRWLESNGATPETTQYFSWDMPFNAPLDDAGVPEYCGRVVFSDLHVSSGGIPIDYAGGNTTVPAGCANTATLQQTEDALEFIFFDLASCVTPVGHPPKPPPPQPEAGAQ